MEAARSKKLTPSYSPAINVYTFIILLIYISPQTVI